ncbi:portal protein [Radicibacter daui]|uniref:portal protein n=1 Tax=Radicibacter daui TaxID=3064829 RepID=UPI004046A12E
MSRPNRAPAASRKPATGRAANGRASAALSATARLLAQCRRALAARRGWEGHWQECYDHVLPQRDGFAMSAPGAKRGDRLFDGTAPDAAEQLAASLLANLAPPWSAWLGLVPGPDLSPAERERFSPVLDRAGAALLMHFDRSNFAVELHQAFLDLVIGGTASLLFEEAPPGELSAFRFTAVPLSALALEEGPQGALDITFRQLRLEAGEIAARFPAARLPDGLAEPAGSPAEAPQLIDLVEAVVPLPPAEGGGYAYSLLLAGQEGEAPLASGRFATSPFINFRWMKAPGETYGRSPVMKALPDIKTANKVVELVLKNASIAVTGIWQADDDGVLNPATIRLLPGTIIPKAVGSAGLQPLQAPGRFDVSQIVLDDLRQRIRKAMIVDRLGLVGEARMTATEVIERSSDMARLLGATYGRLQAELLTPLIRRGLAILRRRGEVPDLHVDGRTVDLQYRSPLAQAQRQRDVQSILRWIEAAGGLGADGLAAVDAGAAARWLGRALGVPGELIRELPVDAGTGAS